MPGPLAIAGARIAGKAVAKRFRGKKVVGKRRRRRARLTQSDLLELQNIKNILGRTAAANALPYYMGRGRG